MKTKCLSLILLWVICNLISPNVQAQIKLKDVLKKKKEEVKKEAPNTTNNKPTNNNSNTTTTKSGKNLSVEQETFLMNYYQEVTQECEAMVWREGVHEGYFMSMYELKQSKIENFLFLVNGLEQRMAQDKTRTPESFKFYGNKAEMPEGMEYGGLNRDFLGSRLGAVSKFITKYYWWKSQVKANFYPDLVQNVQAYLNESKRYATSQLGFAWRYANVAFQFANAFSQLQPNNQEMIKKKQEAQNQIEAIKTALRPKLSGKFHEENFEQVVAFKQKQTLGQENKADIIQEIIPGQPTYLIGYAVDPLTALGAKDVLSTGNRPRLPKFHIEDMEVSIYPYCNEPIFNKMKGAYYIELELFPDLTKTNYASHLNYMPTLHLTEFLLTQPVGTYQVELRFGEDNGSIGPKTKFTIKITEDSKKDLQTYRDQLWAKKLATVNFNTQYGAGDDRNMVSNWQDLSRHGKLVKLSVSQTGTVMRPWPNENQIESYVGSGWILVERTDGKYEVIGYSYIKKPGEQKWRVTAVASDMDYYTLSIPAQLGYKLEAKRLELGYEIPKENIAKGGIW
jgi:hypothetical protein